MSWRMWHGTFLNEKVIKSLLFDENKVFTYSLTPGANVAPHQQTKTCHSHQYDNFSGTVAVLTQRPPPNNPR